MVYLGQRSNRIAEHNLAQLYQAFVEYDTDGSGKLDKLEFYNALRGLDDRQLSLLFRFCDSNNDGGLDPWEALTVYRIVNTVFQCNFCGQQIHGTVHTREGSFTPQNLAARATTEVCQRCFQCRDFSERRSNYVQLPTAEGLLQLLDGQNHTQVLTVQDGGLVCWVPPPRDVNPYHASGAYHGQYIGGQFVCHPPHQGQLVPWQEPPNGGRRWTHRLPTFLGVLASLLSIAGFCITYVPLLLL